MTPADCIALFTGSPLARWASLPPWALTGQAVPSVRELLADLGTRAFIVDGDVAVHRSATVESGAVLKGPAIVGARCFVAHGAYLRGGVWLDEDCIVGPAAELKSSFVFRGSKLAHFNFVGDSILGADVNLEAGSIVANYRNERADKRIRVRGTSGLVTLDITKFGALIGDHGRIGANAVIAPGALLPPHAVVPRLALWDAEQHA
jgi:UDP-N-acetylglucosamine diphosphorylase / glucose-1-phosphate thymidylyltransferase / UDP-N-acetylgalactosamine diphosphorylase / glucosamine-1-phosphate N-acetyltransferase / galactosamine-1-phosphate N-acetyltransferase